jgi:hypothetical protein
MAESECAQHQYVVILASLTEAPFAEPAKSAPPVGTPESLSSLPPEPPRATDESPPASPVVLDGEPHARKNSNEPPSTQPPRRQYMSSSRLAILQCKAKLGRPLAECDPSTTAEPSVALRRLAPRAGLCPALAGGPARGAERARRSGCDALRRGAPLLESEGEERGCAAALAADVGQDAEGAFGGQVQAGGFGRVDGGVAAGEEHDAGDTEGDGDAEGHVRD